MVFPEPITHFVFSSALNRWGLAYLRVGSDGSLVDFGGDISRYGYEDLQRGLPVSDQVLLLEGILPLNEDELFLPKVELLSGACADVNIHRVEDDHWIVFVDAEEETRRIQVIQQRAHDLALSRLRPDVLAGDRVLLGLDILALQRREDGLFNVVSNVPTWWHHALGDRITELEGLDVSIWSEFLSNFLVDAEILWASFRDGEICSGTWQEFFDDERRFVLEAAALNSGGEHFLLLRPASHAEHEKRRLIQRGRDNLLNYYTLRRDIERQEVLLHCIVHDLSAPLSGVQAGLSLLTAESLSDEGREFLDICMMQSNRLATQIREILDVFSAEAGVASAFIDTSATSDILASATEVIKALTPVMHLHRVTVSLADSIDQSVEWHIAGDRARLDRVLFNLVENALWHSPSEAMVHIDLESVDGDVVLSVLDRGPGVPEQMRDRLFQKFSRGNGSSGKIGLGLYFCRITVEEWDGSIGYSPREGGGSRFWIRIPGP